MHAPWSDIKPAARNYYEPCHAAPHRAVVWLRAFRRGIARTIAAPLYLPHIAYTYLETAWT